MFQEEFSNATVVPQKDFTTKTPSAAELMHAFARKNPPPGMPVRIPESRPTIEQITSTPPPTTTSHQPQAPSTTPAQRTTTVTQTFSTPPLKKATETTITLEKTTAKTPIPIPDDVNTSQPQPENRSLSPDIEVCVPQPEKGLRKREARKSHRIHQGPIQTPLPRGLQQWSIGRRTPSTGHTGLARVLVRKFPGQNTCRNASTSPLQCQPSDQGSC